MSLEFKVGKSIDFELGMLAEAHIAQLIFLEVAFYPKALYDQSEHRPGRADEIADLQLINLGDNACSGRPHSGITKIEQSTTQRYLLPRHQDRKGVVWGKGVEVHVTN